MSAMPAGKVRPPIEAPKVRAAEVCNPSPNEFVKRWVSSYRFLDDSEYTMREFDYRLRWTLYAYHKSMTNEGQHGHLRVTVDVWSRRDQEWHELWEEGRAGISPFSLETRKKVSDWNRMLSTLAQYATEVLL